VSKYNLDARLIERDVHVPNMKANALPLTALPQLDAHRRRRHREREGPRTKAVSHQAITRSQGWPEAARMPWVAHPRRDRRWLTLDLATQASQPGQEL
jgi:hypothetical protein